MEQVLRVAVLALLGSRNPVADAARIQRPAPKPRGKSTATPKPRAKASTPKAPRIIPPPKPQTGARRARSAPRAPVLVQPLTVPLETRASSTLGRSFEDRVVSDILPALAERLQVKPVGRLYRLTRHVAHCGDLALHYQGQVGLVELKNHSRALPVTDRRRFFDSLMVHYKHLDWAILVTSHCSVPHFGEKGYVVVGRLCLDIQDPQKTLPVAFVCGLDTLGVSALETAIRAVTAKDQTGPLWTASDLLTRGEATRTLSETWGKTDGVSPFLHPVGAVF